MLKQVDTSSVLLDVHVLQSKNVYCEACGDLEKILAYLKKMEYKNVTADSGKPLWNVILERKLQQKNDGKGVSHGGNITIPDIPQLVKICYFSTSLKLCLVISPLDITFHHHPHYLL
ncbi:uncharacterized protein VP01_4081g2 [Puccinia sorghi]|uniref:Uncharacterized protein n=1 Tax=Puccinia sorghi TaxID=27349 RepID=A0A0L6URI0_9BASI|nr:uncharacterized protein VP01_4081g2 [Puccinia sorghi]